MSILKPEDKHQDIRGSILAPREPYHLPGYAGHKPQYKYQCGDTFGVTTHRLLTSAGPQRTEATIFRPVDPPRAHTVALGFHDVPKLPHEHYDVGKILDKRRVDFGDQLYTPNMRSGYAGFIPRVYSSAIHSKTYPNTCNEALREFGYEQINHKERQRTLADTLRMQYAKELLSADREMLGTKHKLPLRAVRSSLPPYISKKPQERHDSPYFLPKTHSQKYFKSGYAGHVPFYKDLAGNNYPTMTNQALKMFADDMEKHHSLKDVPLSSDIVNRQKVPLPPMTNKPKVYLLNAGIIPRYAGYVPGNGVKWGQASSLTSITNLHFNRSKIPFRANIREFDGRSTETTKSSKIGRRDIITDDITNIVTSLKYIFTK